MEDKKVYPVRIVDFLRTKKSRIVITSEDIEHPALEEQWLVLKDMFEFAGKLNASNGQIRDEHRKKVLEFLEDMGWIGCYEKFVTACDSDSKFANKAMELECIRLDIVDMLITQNVFRPKQGTDEYKVWIQYLKHIKYILDENRTIELLNVIDSNTERLTKPFEEILITPKEAAKMAQCKTGAQFVEIIEKMGLVTYSNKDIVSYEEKFFKCTKRTIKIKVLNAPELVELVQDYMKKYDIPPYIKKSSKKKKVHCIDTDITYLSVAKANEAFGKASNNHMIRDCCNGKIEKAYGHRWEWID